MKNKKALYTGTFLLLNLFAISKANAQQKSSAIVEKTPVCYSNFKLSSDHSKIITDNNNSINLYKIDQKNNEKPTFYIAPDTIYNIEFDYYLNEDLSYVACLKDKDSNLVKLKQEFVFLIWAYFYCQAIGDYEMRDFVDAKLYTMPRQIQNYAKYYGYKYEGYVNSFDNQDTNLRNNMIRICTTLLNSYYKNFQHIPNIKHAPLTNTLKEQTLSALKIIFNKQGIYPIKTR